MQSVKPILSDTTPIRVSLNNDKSRLVIIEDGEEVNLMNDKYSSMTDIIDLRNKMMSEETLLNWLRLNKLGDFLCKYYLGSDEYIVIGADKNIYGFAHLSDNMYKDEEKIYKDYEEPFAEVQIYRVRELRGNNLDANWNTIKDSLSSTIDKFKEYNDKIGDIVKDKSEQYINLLGKSHISDYVSFENLALPTDEYEVIEVSTDDIYYDEQEVLLDNTPSNIELRTTDEDFEVVKYQLNLNKPIYKRVVNLGDIIELAIGYQYDGILISDEGMEMNSDEMRMSSDSKEAEMRYRSELDGVIVRTNEEGEEEYFGLIKIESSDGNQSNILINGAQCHYGQTLASTYVITLVVDEDIMLGSDSDGDPYRYKIGNDLLVEVYGERVVVYSINPNVKEYIIKSCRLIKF